MKNTKIFKKEVYDLVKDEYEVLGEYIDTNTYIRMKHNKCGHEWDIVPVDFLTKDIRCPECANKIISNASKFIEQYLSENNIYFIKEKKFSDCKYKKQLPFDFYLPEYNLLLEYDGEQNFKDAFNNNFNVQHKRDTIKNKYCITNKINLIRIKYNISILKIKEILNSLFNEQLSIEDYKKYGLYVIDIEDDIIYNERTYYKEFM